MSRRARIPRGSPPARSRGMALLVAILLVALGTMLAATIGYESAMAARRTVSTYAFDQSVLVAEAAEGLAAYGLREVWRANRGPNRTINPNQAWSQPVGPFEVVPGVMLDGQLEDLQGRFNINSLVIPDTSAAGRGNFVVDPEARAAFENLLTLVQVEPRWAGLIIDWIDPDIQPQTPEGAEDSVYMGQNPPYLTPNRYITSISELLALPGFGIERYQKIAPFITALPPDVPINLCSASPQVLDAFLRGNREFSSDVDRFNKERKASGGCYPLPNDYKGIYTQYNPVNQAAQTPNAGVSTQNTVQQGSGFDGHFKSFSTYFRLSTHIVTDSGAEFNVYSLLLQDDAQGTVRPILRSYTPD